MGAQIWDSSHPWIRGEIEGFVGTLGRLHRTAMTRCSYRPAGRAALAAQLQSEVRMRWLKQSRIRPCAFEPFIRTSLGCSACEEDESSTPRSVSTLQRLQRIGPSKAATSFTCPLDARQQGGRKTEIPRESKPI